MNLNQHEIQIVAERKIHEKHLFASLYIAQTIV